MRNISDIIEEYLKQVLAGSNDKFIEIKRTDIAEKFQCVPSQINYVINTRFTVEKGFVVESKRGGGGYIRIIKVKTENYVHLIDQLLLLINDRISQGNAENVVLRLLDEQIISEREARIMLSVIDRTVLQVLDLPERDQLRAELLKGMIRTLKFRTR
ncbi:CtsR family transcriptional regulator [Fictibacillus enclensis]|uniref:Transcriptional regulator CtsR n=1 Tax=Fictibacillus enclensis TaxID=1017270 RepID=A0A0V8IUF4_9BACL|nr:MULTISPECIES: CtsR family transcriptional regulator [Fictibacillus]KSU78407.1 CtsR family transcriptional regulator [Fictibacillus enclensis]MDM5196864.1 CtsR family transcriptional regulator [Fictibacillus enclensis]MDM5335992.1 CtsR family transcriptional regulator [Fictibacillus enclensis]RXZ01019.1 CtsR family transcriptional regulator [Fictibacillus sp. S7]WHY72485.1 CtsR family transcriptional regulator [Fictibacillus enclensis]